METTARCTAATKSGMRIAIVGNAGYLLERNDGELIDDCDVVIRMNNFQLSGYRAQVGSRCDIAMTNFSPYSINFQNPALCSARLLVSSRPMNFRRAAEFGIRDRMGEHVTAGMHAMRSRNVYVPELSYFAQRVRHVGCYPTTGLMSLYLVLDHLADLCEGLYLTGFSFFDGRSHYFSDQTVAADQLHNLEAERDEFSRIIHSNRDWIRVDPIMQQHLRERDSFNRSSLAVANTRRSA